MMLDRLRENILGKHLKRLKSPPDDIFKSIEWLRVFSASGTAEEGATVDEISIRTQIPPTRLATILNEMTARQILLFNVETQCFIPMYSHYIFEGLKNDEFFKAWYAHSLLECKKISSARFQSEKDLFFSSIFSVSAERMPELRTELKALLQRFTEDSEAPRGNSLAQLVVGFFTNP